MNVEIRFTVHWHTQLAIFSQSVHFIITISSTASRLRPLRPPSPIAPQLTVAGLQFSLELFIELKLRQLARCCSPLFQNSRLVLESRLVPRNLVSVSIWSIEAPVTFPVEELTLHSQLV